MEYNYIQRNLNWKKKERKKKTGLVKRSFSSWLPLTHGMEFPTSFIFIYICLFYSCSRVAYGRGHVPIHGERRRSKEEEEVKKKKKNRR